MKKIFFICFNILLFMSACDKDSYTIDEDFEQAEITGVTMFDSNMARSDQKSTIDSGTGTISVTLKANQDITHLKLAVTVSTGADVSPTMSVGYQDFSTPKKYTVTSPGKTITKEWTITVANP